MVAICSIEKEDQLAGCSQKRVEIENTEPVAGTSRGCDDGGAVCNLGGDGGAVNNPGCAEGASVEPGYFTPPDRILPRSPELPSRPPVLLHADEPPSYLQMLANDVSLL